MEWEEKNVEERPEGKDGVDLKNNNMVLFHFVLTSVNPDCRAGDMTCTV